MTDTLTRIEPLLRRLFDDAKTNDAAALAPFFALPQAERDAVMHSAQTDPRAFYSKMANAYLPVSEETGRLLYVLARSRGARCVVEFGTSFGLSTLFLAAALRDGGGGRVVTTEYEPGKVLRARANLTEAGLVDLVEFREGDALETLRAELPGPIDLMLLDGAKPLYVPILQLLEPQLTKNAVVVADNVKMAPELTAYLAGRYVTVPWADGDCLLALRTA